MGKPTAKKAPINRKPTRKQMRKTKRLDKKAKKNEYHTKRSGRFASNDVKNIANQLQNEYEKIEKPKNVPKKEPTAPKMMTMDDIHRKEKQEQMKIQKDMRKQRNQQLLQANEVEDKNIRKLEKLLKLNKRKGKGLPKYFAEDGLDYLLEVCDPEYMKTAAAAEQDVLDTNENFEEDFGLMAEKITKKKPKQDISEEEDGVEEEQSDDDDLVSNDEFGEEIQDFDSEDDEEFGVSDEELSEDSDKVESEEPSTKKAETIEDVDDEEQEEDVSRKDNVWEDIYGRLRSEDGAILPSTSKYIPPAIRAKMESGPEDVKRRVKLDRLKKQLKGLLNRLAESNMHNVANQIETLFMSNSRNDMNETLTLLICEALIGPVLTPERLLIEHALLIVVLHANVGQEVGAHFLQNIVKQFNQLFTTDNVEDKHLDNVCCVLAQLYNFKVYDAKLLYEILHKLAGDFNEKTVECILHILRSVGFVLRKDDPLALKNLILELQKQAAIAVKSKVDNTRVKFLLDILLAIRNNNMNKIPNYDVTYSEHLKKLLKGFIRKGNYVTPLNISLEDLLNADTRGKWWVVGSAWTGKTQAAEINVEKNEVFSDQLLQLAKKHRMNTDTRRDIFCILLSADDVQDAFHKLLKLGLKPLQEREIIHVIVHCCLKEKSFNKYYPVLAQNFCEYHRRFQMIIKCTIWDKLKALDSHSGAQISNLAKLLTHLFINEGLSISILKVVAFVELDKTSQRFIRQIMLGILLHEDTKSLERVFGKVAVSDKLKTFRESLRLFINVFIRHNLKSEIIDETDKEKLKIRCKLVEKMLSQSKSSW